MSALFDTADFAALTALPQPPAEPAPTDDELRALYPEVDALAVRMRAELWQNRSKGDQPGWRKMSPREAWGEISWHVGKLAGALKAEDIPLMRELSADIANCALMFDDILAVAGLDPSTTD